MKLIILSPHRDDAAFSVSFSVAQWLQRGHRVRIVNVFTCSLYAPYADAESIPKNDRLRWVSALRKREDEALLQKFPGLTMIDLDLQDAPIRLNCDSSTVCEIEPDPRDAALARIRTAVVNQIAEDPANTCLVVPLSLGRHIDHRVVREALLPLTPSVSCAFYEDLPYAMREGVRFDLSSICENARSRFNEPLSPVLCHGTSTRPIERKFETAMLYPSQINEEVARGLAAFSNRYHGAERLWANKRWLDIAKVEGLSTLQRDPTSETFPK